MRVVGMRGWASRGGSHLLIASNCYLYIYLSKERGSLHILSISSSGIDNLLERLGTLLQQPLLLTIKRHRHTPHNTTPTQNRRHTKTHTQSILVVAHRPHNLLVKENGFTNRCCNASDTIVGRTFVLDDGRGFVLRLVCNGRLVCCTIKRRQSRRERHTANTR